MAERGVALAEVVERELHPGLDDPLELGDRDLGVLHHRGLGDLEHERVRLEPGLRERAPTICSNWGSMSCRADTLTFTRTSGAPCARQSRAWVQAS